MDMNKDVAFQDEVMLIGWSESNTRGRTVTFLLNEDGDAHPFRDFTVKSGKRGGQRFACVLVQLDDDDSIKERRPSQVAYLTCQDETFWAYINEYNFADVQSEHQAAEFIYERCNISSRSELDTNTKARMAWEGLIYGPYQKYLDALAARSM